MVCLVGASNSSSRSNRLLRRPISIALHERWLAERSFALADVSDHEARRGSVLSVSTAVVILPLPPTRSARRPNAGYQPRPRGSSLVDAEASREKKLLEREIAVAAKEHEVARVEEALDCRAAISGSGHHALSATSAPRSRARLIASERKRRLWSHYRPRPQFSTAMSSRCSGRSLEIDTEAADNVALGVLAPVLAAMAERGSEEALALLDQVAASSTDQEAKEHA